MDEIIAACMSYEGTINQFEDFPKSDVPVWILGQRYSTETDLEELKSDVQTKLWITYRRNFPAIGDTGLTTDKGWGCMLRCGQMALAEALMRMHLGRDWRWSLETKDKLYLRIVSLFEDSRESCFSIHQMAQLGVDEGKAVGEWYGPNTVAHVLRKLTPFDQWNKICVHVVMDNVFIKDEIRSSCQISGEKSWHPLLLFIPLRLGVSEINPIYFNGLKKSLKMPQSLGIIGGKPNHALYFIGFMGDEIVYLDPHTTQDSGQIGSKNADLEKELDLSYHCAHAQRMPFQMLNPSLALCFLCTSEKEFGDLCNRLRQELIDSEKAPLLEVHHTRPSFLKDDNTLGAVGIDLEGIQLDSDEDEEFEVLE